MLTGAGGTFCSGMDLKGVHTVGDSLRDLQAVAAAGCSPHLVYTGKSEKLKGQALPVDLPQGTVVHDDLGAFADWLLAQPEPAAKNNKVGAHA